MVNQNIAVACAVEGQRPAVIDSAHRSIINFEVFYFSDEPAKARFDAHPLEYCGILTDPVVQARFVPGQTSPRIDWEGRTFYFVSDETRAQFEAMPDSFSVPRYTMRDMPTAAPDSNVTVPADPATATPHG